MIIRTCKRRIVHILMQPPRLLISMSLFHPNFSDGSFWSNGKIALGKVNIPFKGEGCCKLTLYIFQTHRGRGTLRSPFLKVRRVHVKHFFTFQRRAIQFFVVISPFREEPLSFSWSFRKRYKIPVSLRQETNSREIVLRSEASYVARRHFLCKR